MKLFKRIAAILGGLVVLAVAAVLIKFYVLSPKSRPAPAMQAKATPEAIKRGEYLANHVAACVGCHSKIDDTVPGDKVVDGTLGGGRDFGAPADSMVKPRAPNITPDKENGIGAYTDGEIVRALREGIGRDGHALFPMMPYQTYAKSLSDDDALAIVAYLRTLPPLSTKPGPTELGFPVSMFIRAAPQPLAAPPGPPPTDPLAHGQWLLSIASCADCHDSVNNKREPIPGKHLAGGTKFVAGPRTVYASNITPDPATGIGSYSDEDILRVLNEGKNKSGRTLYVMPWSLYKGMTEEDKRHMLLALRAIQPVNNVVPPPTGG